MQLAGPKPIAIAVFDIDGVVRDVSLSYRRAIADTVERFTDRAFRPTMADIDRLKSEGIWNNDWEASQELAHRYWEGRGRSRSETDFRFEELVDFFQACYRGTDPENWNGYICQEPVSVGPEYWQALTRKGIAWGFFSGAPRDEATYVLDRLDLRSPVLVAMEDAPGKPDPRGLLDAVRQLETRHELPENLPVLYAGDTTADMYAIGKARQQQPDRSWVGVGVLPPHVSEGSESDARSYGERLRQAGATAIVPALAALSGEAIARLLSR